MHASASVVFPRKHTQREVGIVLDASEITWFSITSADIRPRTKRRGVELTHHRELFIVGCMKGACEGFGYIVTSLGHHALLQPFQIVFFLDDSLDFGKRF